MGSLYPGSLLCSDRDPLMGTYSIDSVDCREITIYFSNIDMTGYDVWKEANGALCLHYLIVLILFPPFLPKMLRTIRLPMR